MILLYRLLILALIQNFFSIEALPAYATRVGCTNSSVAFEYNGPEELKCLCSTTKSAIDFLKSIGLETTDCISIKLVNYIPSKRDHILIGACNPRSQEVTLLTYPKTVELSQRHNPISEISMSEDLWCSYAAHELAHVISSQHLNPKIKAHTAGEYISAITQLTVLPSKIRNKILSKYEDIDAYQSRAEMSEFYYLAAPNRFAVKCYLHFIAQKNPREFIELLVKEGNGF